MTQLHGAQYGTFHITTNAHERIPWCIAPGIPDRLIENLFITRNLHNANVHAFCILPNHMHIMMTTGPRGLSAFAQSFKTNSMKDVRFYLGKTVRVGRRHGVSAAESTAIPTNNDPYIGWQHGFHDERIRDSRQRSACFRYIQANAINHGLVRDVSGWPWSSFHFDHLTDPMEMWLD